MYLQADRDAGSLGKGFCVVSALSWVAAAGLGDQRVLGGAGVWGLPGAEGELRSRGAHSSAPPAGGYQWSAQGPSLVLVPLNGTAHSPLRLVRGTWGALLL